MKENRITAAIVAALLGLLVLGCSGAPSPVSPVTDAKDILTTPGIEDSGGRHLWGLWECSMQPGSSAIDIVPLRTAMFTANVNKLLEGAPGNLQISELDPTNFESEGLLPCTVTLRHPFAGLGQFHGFDVWGVFMHNGNTNLSYDGLTYSGGGAQGEDEAVLLNADGFTRWFNFPEFGGTGLPIFEFTAGKLSNLSAPTATLNPYRSFADGLGKDDDLYEWATSPGNTDDRMIYRSGQVNSRRYELKFPLIGGVPVVHFQYAAVANWEQGDPELTGQPAEYDPFDFPTSANVEEAFLIHTTTDDSDLYYAGPGSYGGSLKADIEVFDWQGGIVGNNGVPNEVNRIVLEGDFIPGGSHEWSQPELAAVAIPGSENSSVFQVEIANCEPQAAGEAGFWVIVEAGGMHGESYDQGYPTEFPEGAHRAAFNTGAADVGTEPPFIPVEYNLVITVVRGTNNIITGIKLDWDDNDGITGYNIYRQDPFDTTDDWELIPDSPVTVSEYVDTDIVGYEAYQYRVVGLVGSTEMPDESVYGYAILENAEDNVSGHSVWDTCAFPIMYNPSWLPMSLFNEFAPLDQTPQNGSYCWDEGGLQNGPGDPGTYWTGSATLFATPILPLPDGSATCIADFCIRLNNMIPWWPGWHCGTIVGVTNEVEDGPSNPFIPSNEYLDGLDYNLDHIQGFSLYELGWVDVNNYTNVDTTNDRGHGIQYPGYQDIQYAWSQFAVQDVFTVTDARVAFAWACANSAGGTNIPNAGTSFDDIAIIVY